MLYECLLLQLSGFVVLLTMSSMAARVAKPKLVHSATTQFGEEIRVLDSPNALSNPLTPSLRTERCSWDRSMEFFDPKTGISHTQTKVHCLGCRRQGGDVSKCRVSRERLSFDYQRASLVGLSLTMLSEGVAYANYGSNLKVLLLGVGGGSFAMFLHTHFPGALIDAVEISHEVIFAASTYFGLDTRNEHLRIHHGDARSFVKNIVSKNQTLIYDVVFLDAYGKGFPTHLRTVEFFIDLKRVLK